MKKFSTLFISSLFSLSLLAYDGSSLSISAFSNNMNLKVEVDGQRVAMLGNSVTLNNLREGDHNVRIYREKKRDNFRFDFGSRYEIIYATSVCLSRLYHTDIIISSSGKAFVDSYRVDADGNCLEDNNAGYYGGNDNATGGGWNNGYGNVMSTGEFQDVKGSISKEWFEANRLISAKTIIDKNNFTSQQVKEMMQLFTFESNKLEVAKYAYRKAVNKENYFLVNDAFTFSSSKDELARFIRESR